MKKIGFVDYYISEWHANNYPEFIKNVCEKTGQEFEVAYVWAEEYVSPVDGVNTDQWCEKFGAEKCATIDELCEKSDYIVVLSPDNPEKHLEYAKAVLKYKKNTYIDKTFAPDLETAKAIFAEAEKYGTKFFSTSALRCADEFEGADCSEGLIVTSHCPDISIYAIHPIEIMVCLMKAKPVAVKTIVQNEKQAISVVSFENGKKASLIFGCGYPFTINCCGKDMSFEYKPLESDFFGNLLADILKFFETGVEPFDGQETLNVIAIRDALMKSVDVPDTWVEI